MPFFVFILLIIIVRIGELLLSKRNEKWLLTHGAIEYGSGHYPYIVALHASFFISLVIEYCSRHNTSYSLEFLILYLLVLVCKAWVILSLGKFWNVKIYHIPNVPLVKNGPYKFIKHPNYILVVTEIAIIPLIFHLYYTAVIFSILNAIVLCIRIREENKVLQE